MAELDEMVKDFLVESAENLEQLDRELLQLEENPKDLQTVNVIFRIIHTVKGTCGFFDFKLLESVAHVGENLLDSIRAGKVPVTDEIINALLKLTDTIKELLTNVAETGTEGTVECGELVSWLTRLNEVAATPKTSTTHTTEEILDRTPCTPCSPSPVEQDPLEALFEATKEEYSRTNAPGTEHQGVPVKQEQLECASGSVKRVETGKKNSEGETDQKRSDVADTTLRVDIGLLDTLMNLVGELVLARNQILQFTKTQRDGDFLGTSQRLNLITSELQEGVMRTRMQPISTVWNKLPRIVRDIAHACNKDVTLETQGKETELDKTIIEAIKDPLTHIIRNAVDHGIEIPRVRTDKGKSPGGTLLMRAFHEGGQVIIEISDDGAGLQSERIKAKALEKGLITPERAESMSEADTYRLIFLPGFSTAEKVTNLSGRGVGMDVVRSNIERIGGTVDVTSQPGRGTTFTIRIPLTLAIIPGLIVTAGLNQYAIPQVNLLELLRLENTTSGNGIEKVGGSDFYRLRGKLLPLVYLSRELKLSEKDARSESALNIVVVRADHHQFGLVVDTIHDTEEIVVKPLGRLLKGISSFAGATIMGDGKIALILDVVGIGRSAGVTRKETSVKLSNSTSVQESIEDSKQLLVFTLGKKRRAAIPLEQVYRLEEFSSEKIEETGDGMVVQYRGGILPLIDTGREIFNESIANEGMVKAFVYQTGDSLIGFAVDEIVDIVEQPLKIEQSSRRKGVLGSAIVQHSVTEIIDLGKLLGSPLDSNNTPSQEAR